jgi:NAD(P)-dependent dehydrogenase (short-subunit alcohol dehydrogenase family)
MSPHNAFRAGQHARRIWQEVMAVNLAGVWLCMRAEIRRMGHGIAAYVAAKHGVVGLTKAAALEYATQGIRVNAVCPGTVRTGMCEHVVATGIVTEAEIAAMRPVNRPTNPEEIAEAAAWLLADHASFATGQALAVYGGLVAR